MWTLWRHCRVRRFNFCDLATDRDGHWRAEHTTCPACRQGIVRIVTRTPEVGDGMQVDKPAETDQIQLEWPRTSGRPGCPSAVPADLCKDYTQAGIVLADSPEASAALSRRCLQGVLRAKGYNQKDLSNQIQSALDSNTLHPRYLPVCLTPFATLEISPLTLLKASILARYWTFYRAKRTGILRCLNRSSISTSFRKRRTRNA